MQDQIEPVATWETITPDVAQSILTMNTRNRVPSEHHVKKIATAMKAGHFRITGDAIRIGMDNVLYDGQHRLMACVQAEVPFRTLVIRGIEHDAMMVIDGGKSRTRQQQLFLAEGIKPEETDVALMLLRMGIGPQYTMVSNDTVATIIRKHADIRAVAAAYEEAPKFRLGANIPAAELILRANGYQAEAHAWRAVWTRGEKPELGEVAHGFREELIAKTEGNKAADKLWTAKFRRDVLPGVIMRTAGHAPPATRYYPTTWKFPGMTAERLLTVINFDTPQPVAVAAMTDAPPDVINRMARKT